MLSISPLKVIIINRKYYFCYLSHDQKKVTLFLSNKKSHHNSFIMDTNFHNNVQLVV